MELNGVANIIMALDLYKRGDIDLDMFLESIDNDSKVLIEYLRHIGNILIEHDLNNKIMYWHEIKAKVLKNNAD